MSPPRGHISQFLQVPERGEYDEPSSGTLQRSGRREFLLKVEELVPEVLGTLYRDVFRPEFDPDARKVKGFKKWCKKWGFTDPWASQIAHETMKFWFYRSKTDDIPLRWPNLMELSDIKVSWGDPALPYLEPWFPMTVPWPEYLSRAVERFTAALERYRDDMEAKVAAEGLERVPGRRQRLGDPMVWLVKHQVDGKTYNEIAEEQRKINKDQGTKREEGAEFRGPDVKTVGRRVRQMAKEIGLTLRPAPGRATEEP